ncbi:hypothetical protein M0802_008769 [Mischocyttarus mexicanus]|nr:hypothetical protein M0802_008769 [Mischocyttarus mexicanus]
MHGISYSKGDHGRRVGWVGRFDAGKREGGREQGLREREEEEKEKEKKEEKEEDGSRRRIVHTSAPLTFDENELPSRERSVPVSSHYG